jgi:hypothetical protein
LKHHEAANNAVCRFRFYQAKVEGDSLPVEDNDLVRNPVKSFDAVRQDILVKKLEEPSEREVCHFRQRLLNLVIKQGVPLSFLAYVVLKELQLPLNPNIAVPCLATLQTLLGDRVLSQKRCMRSYLIKQANRGSITLNAWASRDKQKFLGMTLHFFATSSTMASVTIGMERLSVSQTYDVVKESVRKCLFCLCICDFHRLEVVMPFSNVVCLFVCLFARKVLLGWYLESCILGITADQGSNVKKAMNEYEYEFGTAWIPCASHNIHLCVNDAIKNAAFCERYVL